MVVRESPETSVSGLFLLGILCAWSGKGCGRNFQRMLSEVHFFEMLYNSLSRLENWIEI